MKRRTASSLFLVGLVGSIGIAAVGLAVSCGDDTDNSAFSSGGVGQGTSGGNGGTSGFAPIPAGEGGLGTNGGPGGTSGATGFDPDAACASSNVGAERSPANILFIVDRSASMNCNPPPLTASDFCESHPVTADAGAPTKWTITRDALEAAITALPNTYSPGVTYFNVNDSDEGCDVHTTPDVPVKPISSDQIAAVNTSLGNVHPRGLTPIVGAVLNGYTYLHTTPELQGKKNVLVLITDGSETCATAQQQADLISTAAGTPAGVDEALSVGISTFVIGAPGSELNRSYLSQIAFLGGTASSASCSHGDSDAGAGDCHFDLTNAGADLATQLAAALDTITKKTLGCDYDVPTGSGMVDYGKVNVIYTPSPAKGGAAQTVAQDTTKACDQGANGWQYSPDGKRITLCGDACSSVKADPGGSVSIQLGCLTETVPK